MLTVLRVQGLQFFFFSNEGTELPHIHVEAGDGYAKLWLSPVKLVCATGLIVGELRRICLPTLKPREDVLASWNQHFCA